MFGVLSSLMFAFAVVIMSTYLLAVALWVVWTAGLGDCLGGSVFRNWYVV